MSGRTREQKRTFTLALRGWVAAVIGLLIMKYSYSIGLLLFYGGLAVGAWGTVAGSYRYAISRRERATPPTNKASSTNLPKESDFPEGTQFYIKEFDVPLVHDPSKGWFNWYGGHPRKYDPKRLSGYGLTHWPAESFEEWIAIVEASL